MGGAAPLYGSSGFGNFYNNYTWSMGVFKNELYVGTMDWSYLLEDGIKPLWQLLGLPEGTTIPLPNSDPGADLWRFRGSETAAEPINTTGVGNYLNYGIRTMVVNAENMYLGSANPMNLMTNLADDKPEGGWELIQMVSSPDLGLTKWSDSAWGSTMAHTGDLFDYHVRVTNYGFAQATNVIVVDKLPPEVTYNGANYTCSMTTPPYLVCNVGAIAGNDGYSPASKELVISVYAPSQPGYLLNNAYTYCDQADPDFSNNSNHLFTLVDYSSELGVEKTAEETWVGPGQDLHYAITVTNSGAESFLPIIPFTITNTEYIHIPTYGVSFPYPSDQLELQNLQGEIENVTVSLNDLNHTRTSDLDVMLVSPNLTKVLLMSHAGGGLNFSSMKLTFEDGYPTLPESSPIVSGRYSPTDYSMLPPVFPLAPMGPYQHSLSALRGENPNGIWRLYVYDHLLGLGGYINNGWTLNLSLKRGLVVDQLPEYTLYNGYGGSNWNCYEDDPGVATCHTDAEVGAGASSALFLYPYTTSFPPPDLPKTITNTATIQPGAYDPDPDNNQAEATVIFYPAPDLEIEKSTIHDEEVILPGSVFTYTLEVMNDSEVGPASDVMVEDNLPSEVTAAVVDPRCSLVDQHVTCGGLGELWPGEALDPPLVITATAPNIVTWITNRAEVDSEQDDADHDNFVYLWSLVDKPTDLEIIKTASQPSVLISQTLTYTLSVTNLGTGDFTPILPFNVTNPDQIHIPSSGVADPYPSSMVPISGLSGKVAHVSVTLNQFYHERTSDLKLLLVGPDHHTGVILMAGAGTGVFVKDVTFDDDASGLIPEDAEIESGSYQPTDYRNVHFFPFPAPIGPYNHTLSALNGLDPNGHWRLYLVDEGLHRDGDILGGWTLNLTLERAITVHDQLPGTIIVNNSQPGDWDCDIEVGDVLCTNDLPLPVDATSEIKLGVSSLYTTSLTIANTATVETDSYDPNPINNISEYILNQWKWWLPAIMLDMLPTP